VVQEAQRKQKRRIKEKNKMRGQNVTNKKDTRCKPITYDDRKAKCLLILCFHFDQLANQYNKQMSTTKQTRNSKASQAPLREESTPHLSERKLARLNLPRKKPHHHSGTP
jgi:hypothetical protein